jgi:WD40 repeat protein
MHFQLRNILAVADRNNLFFSAADQVNSFHPITHTVQDPFLDLGEDGLPDHYPIRISTLGACGGQDAVLVAGGFNGTFALKPLNANLSAPPITGTITDHDNGITNHIHLLSSPGRAVVCSNDNHIRIMDVSRGKFTSHHPFPWAVNCSATAPDSKLRVVVGDSKETLVVDAQRGRTEFVLKGHQDFGFAAAWSEDGVTLATGNQDQTVRIYDARSLRQPLKVFPMKMAGCRTLRFSPLGNGGRRVLAMAEPADLVHFVDATNWSDAQTLSFWGEVGGIAFSPDGEEFYIANCDRYVGGITTLARKRGVGWYHLDEHDDHEQEEEEEPAERRRWKRRGADLGGVYV